VSADSLLERARKLAPLVSGAARAGEAERNLRPEVAAALAEIGAYTLLVPRALGGAELAPSDAMRVIEEISRQDASAGWCVGTAGVTAALVAGRVAPEVAREIFALGARSVCAGGLVPSGRARPAPGGYRISGCFRFASGIRYATTAVGGCLVFEGETPRLGANGMPELLVFCCAPSQIRIVDNWEVAGLEATGSCDFETDDLFVPEGSTFPLLDPGRAPRGSLASLSAGSVAYVNHAGFALGVARRALDEVRAVATSKQRLGSTTPLAENAAFLSRYARAETRLRAARSLVLQSLAGIWDEVQRGGASPRSEAELGAAAVLASDAAAGATQFALRAGGAHAIFRDEPLQRCFRDLHAGRQHIAVGEEVWERAGRQALAAAARARRD
jgi:alkylation response protein AidB-like acyl-CoA dehydrogenase